MDMDYCVSAGVCVCAAVADKTEIIHQILHEYIFRCIETIQQGVRFARVFRILKMLAIIEKLVD